MEKFKYDIYTLIEAVENKPCLWDKSIDHYKDKIMRKNAWRFVCSILEPDFENFEIKMQEDIITIVMNKWTHIRDSFMRSMKSKSGQESKRKYVYAEYMQFLLKNMTADDTESSIQSGPSTRDDDSDVEEANILQNGDIPKPNNKRKKINNIDKEILNAIRSSSPAIKEHTIDEDKAFLMSLLPTLKKISDDDKIDFRIEMMQLLNNYFKRNRNTFNKYSFQIPSPMTRESTSPQSSSSHFDSQYLPSPSAHQSPAPNKTPRQSTIRILSSSQTVRAPNLSQVTKSYELDNQLSASSVPPENTEPPSPQSASSHFDSQYLPSPSAHQSSMQNEFHTSYQLSSPHQPSASSVPPANTEQPVWIQILEHSATKEAKTAADFIQNYKFE